MFIDQKYPIKTTRRSKGRNDARRVPPKFRSASSNGADWARRPVL